METGAFSLSALFAFLLLASSAVASVEDVCKVATGDPGVNYDFCVKSLKAVPGSETADNLGLAVIAAKLAETQTASIKGQAGSLLKSATDAKVKECLSSCEEVFDNAIGNLDDAIQALKVNDIETARTMFSAAMDAPGTCNDGFSEFQLQNPLAQDSDAVLQLSTIALSISSNL